MRLWFLVAAALALATVAHAQSKGSRPAPVSVFITSSGAVNGLTDPNKDRADSVKDLREVVGWYPRDLVLAESAEKAAIVLTVTGRETTEMERILRVKFRFGEVEAEMNGTPHFGIRPPTWGKAAEDVVKQLRQWLKDNRGVLSSK